MIKKIINNHNNLKNIFYNKIDKLRETFDFNNQDITFKELEKYSTILEEEIKTHFAMQEKLKNQINPQVDKLILENMLVRDMLLRMANKLHNGAINKDINIFSFFDDVEEILRAYLKKEKGLFIQELNQATNEEEKEKIKNLLNLF